MLTRKRTVLCTGEQHLVEICWRIWEFTQVLVLLLNITRHNSCMAMKASPLGSDWRFLLCLTLSHWEQRMQAKTWQSYPMLPLIAQTAPRRSGHTSWALAPASLEESPVQTETLLNILWFALDEISHQIPLLFMAKYPQATESNFYPFSFRHKFAVFKVETGSDGREKGRKKKKSPSPAVKTALLIFMKR